MQDWEIDDYLYEVAQEKEKEEIETDRLENEYAARFPQRFGRHLHNDID